MMLPRRKKLHLASTELTAEEILTDYLDHLCAPLIGIIPTQERFRMREEAESFLYDRMQAYINHGSNEEEAIHLAIDQYGISDQLAEEFFERWQRKQAKGLVAKTLGLSFSYAGFFWFEATFAAQLILLYRMLSSDVQPYTFGLTQWQLRQIWPEPLPLPETSGIWIALWIYTLCAPLIAGILTGAKVLSGSARTTLISLVLLALGSFMLGTFMLPMKDGLWFAFMQIIWWVPLGTLSSHVTSVLVRRRRLRFQPHRKVKSI